MIQMSIFRGFWEEMTLKSMNSLALKDKFQHELLNVRRSLDSYSLIVLTARLDCKI